VRPISNLQGVSHAHHKEGAGTHFQLSSLRSNCDGSMSRTNVHGTPKTQGGVMIYIHSTWAWVMSFQLLCSSELRPLRLCLDLVHNQEGMAERASCTHTKMST
jgi:hypothetical protein